MAAGANMRNPRISSDVTKVRRSVLRSGFATRSGMSSVARSARTTPPIGRLT